MIDAGHRYKNIEKALGAGSILVLGKDIAETTWTKLLPKSGPKFSAAMDHMKSEGIPALASKYKDLSTQVIEHELNQFTYCTTNMLVPGLGASDPMLDSGNSAFSDPTWAMDQGMNDMTSYPPFSNGELSDIFGGYVDELEFSLQ